MKVMNSGADIDDSCGWVDPNSIVNDAKGIMKLFWRLSIPFGSFMMLLAS
jgi:hypothetical protein